MGVLSALRAITCSPVAWRFGHAPVQVYELLDQSFEQKTHRESSYYCAGRVKGRAFPRNITTFDYDLPWPTTSSLLLLQYNGFPALFPTPQRALDDFQVRQSLLGALHLVPLALLQTLAPRLDLLMYARSLVGKLFRFDFLSVFGDGNGALGHMHCAIFTRNKIFGASIRSTERNAQCTRCRVGELESRVERVDRREMFLQLRCVCADTLYFLASSFEQQSCSSREMHATVKYEAALVLGRLAPFGLVVLSTRFNERSYTRAESQDAT